MYLVFIREDDFDWNEKWGGENIAGQVEHIDWSSVGPTVQRWCCENNHAREINIQCYDLESGAIWKASLTIDDKQLIETGDLRVVDGVSLDPKNKSRFLEGLKTCHEVKMENLAIFTVTAEVKATPLASPDGSIDASLKSIHQTIGYLVTKRKNDILEKNELKMHVHRMFLYQNANQINSSVYSGAQLLDLQENLAYYSIEISNFDIQPTVIPISTYPTESQLPPFIGQSFGVGYKNAMYSAVEKV